MVLSWVGLGVMMMMTGDERCWGCSGLWQLNVMNCDGGCGDVARCGCDLDVMGVMWM